MVDNQYPPVFVTYGWCRTAYAAVLSLGRRGIDVHVSDASSSAMSRYSRYCKSYVKVPDFFVEPERYFDAICEALKKTGAGVLLPAHEDVGIFCRRRNELPPGVRVALPNLETYRVAEDKLAVLDVARRAGCPVPSTTEASSWNEIEKLLRSVTWPVVIKTHIGNSAKGVRIVHNRNEFLAQYRYMVETFHLSEGRWPVVQEFLPGEAAGVCVLYQNGRCIAGFAERYLRCKEPGKFGTSTLRESLADQKLVSHAIAVMDKLKWHGVAHLDFIADKDGDFKLIEINPRLWGALALSVFSGVDFPYLWYLTAMGESVEKQNPSGYPPIKCRWIVGDCMAFMGLVRRGLFAEAMRVLVPQRKCFHDDFVLSDPLPFIFEITDYAAKYIKSGGSTNPVSEGMIR
ncbi:MAG: ATP-grasp domain-containing protein [Sedimentisphaerales bacterium]|jgi:predicted ATP-grasp superfamily ATP-dependent carboligase